MPSILEEILGIGRQPTHREMLDHSYMELEILERMWNGEDRDSQAVRAFCASARVWYLYMEENTGHDGQGTLVNRALHEAFGSFMTGSQKAMDEFRTLGRLRCDAILAATGKSPLTVEEEEAMRDKLAEKHRPQDDSWARSARSAS